MKSRSLIVRTTMAGTVWIVLALAVSGWAILSVFNGSAARQFDTRLTAHLDLLTGAVASSPGSPDGRMSHPDFGRIYSGLYWQAEEMGGSLYRSRSLWDGELVFTITDGPDFVTSLPGPDDQSLRLMARRLTAGDGGDWIVSVAAHTGGLEAERASFRNSLLLAFGLLCFVLITMALVMQRAALSPLSKLRKAVLERHTSQTDLRPEDYPLEIQPLIADLNLVLERNERLREKGRAQAANLAHALKTPSAVLRNELTQIRRGETMNIKLAEEAVDKIAAVADRHLALVSAAPGDGFVREETDFMKSANEVVRALERLFEGKTFELAGPETQMIEMGRADQFELLGNLVENAGKFARSRIRITVEGSQRGKMLQLAVEDDGPGVPEQSLQRIMGQGVRLDETSTGHGLGLTIVQDTVDRYEGDMNLARSDLGGLKVEISI